MNANGESTTENLPTVRQARPPVLVPATFAEQMQWGERYLRSGLAPASFKTPEAIAIAIQMGTELGLFPTQSLRLINVINNKPGLSADGIVAVILASGKALYFYPEEQSATRAIFVTQRKGAPAPVRYCFTIDQAQTAGLVQKNPVYKAFPERMLAARAKSFLGRDVYPDIVGGLLSTEELQDIEVTATHVSSVPLPRATTEAPTLALASSGGEEPPAETITDDERKALFRAVDTTGKTHDDLRRHLEALGVHSTAALPRAQYPDVLRWAHGTEAAA